LKQTQLWAVGWQVGGFTWAILRAGSVWSGRCVFCWAGCCLSCVYRIALFLACVDPCHQLCDMLLLPSLVLLQATLRC
jgi:hypothetical protein